MHHGSETFFNTPLFDSIYDVFDFLPRQISCSCSYCTLTLAFYVSTFLTPFCVVACADWVLWIALAAVRFKFSQ
jgi:hypothetical protein